jgi:protein-tyrosine phosphatase
MKVLMVCLGNICRSPVAEGWLRMKGKERNVAIEVDSAGTANYHVGKKPDQRMIEFAKNYGLELSELRARQFSVNDFDKFDVIFAMDQSNLNTICSLARNESDSQKVKLYLNELYPNQNKEVPDPYYDGKKEFEFVIELLEKTANSFLDAIEKIKNERK